MNDTIAAIATAHGVAAISIIRLSGPEALRIAAAVAPRAPFTPRYASLSDLYDASGELIDRGIVLYFQAPRSFTGEDIVEFQVHGGLVIAEQILESLFRHGARPARPGEFSKRAFLHGKIDLSRAEAIARIIEAKSATAARILARQLQGDLAHFVEEIREALLRAKAYAEVSIDYAEEELPETLGDELRRQLLDITERLRHLSESSRRRRGVVEGFRIAIVGKPNVGKSSLLNAILSYERAIVSEVAGTTRDTIEEQIRLGTHSVRIIDTAGIRRTDDRVEQIGVERSLSSLEEADIVLALFDRSRSWEREDETLLRRIERIAGEEKDVLVVLNKCDLPARLPDEALSRFAPLEISTRYRITDLIEAIERRLDARASGDELMLSSLRQIEAVEGCTEAIEKAVAPLERGELELFSYHIAEAAESIGRITHPYDNEEVLERMFGEFCLGK